MKCSLKRLSGEHLGPCPTPGHHPRLGRRYDWREHALRLLAFGRILSINGGDPSLDTHLFGFTGARPTLTR